LRQPILPVVKTALPALLRANTKTLLWVLLPRPTIIATRRVKSLMSRSKLCHVSLFLLLMTVSVRAWGQG
jgi:hypothetical protein